MTRRIGPQRPSPTDSARDSRPVVRARLGRWMVVFAASTTALLLVGGLLLVTLVWVTTQNLPAYEELVTKPRGQSVNVRAADGSILAHIGPNYGEWLPAAALPNSIKTAMVAVEDRRFYHHYGVDPLGLARALWINLRAHRWVQGGSTITQQVVKNLFLTSEKSFGRKGREMITALALDTKFSKEQILELYLNRVYFGGGAYGVDAASRRFFGHSARTMSLAEAVVIAGLVKAPTRYAPSSDPVQALKRAHVVVDTMISSGAITPDQATRIHLPDLRFAPQPRENDVRYFTDWVLTQVESLTNEAAQPIDVMTTLVPTLQRAAETAIARNTPQGLQGGLVALGYDGAIKALVGGRDYVNSSYNRAVYARRQPGSAFKLFVYLAALESGMTPETETVDEPVTFGNWSPVNNNRRNIGPVNLTQALALSINTVAVRIADQVGFESVASMARRLGISTPIATTPSMALGASEVTLLDLTGAYATVARGGSTVKPFAIRQIIRADGVNLYTYAPPFPEQAVSADVAANMTRMLAAVVSSGTGRVAQLDRPTAGKTGTTSDNRDGWFLGFTGDLTAGVWMGRDDARSVPGLAGGKLPAATWADFMRQATQGLPAQPLFALTPAEAGQGPNEPDQDALIAPPSEGGAPEGQGQAPTDPDTVPADGTGAQIIEPHGPEPRQKGPVAKPPRLNQDWLDKTLKDSPPPPQP